MLRGIRTASSNWLGKAVLTVIMGLLIVSFAIWGIGDVFRGIGRSAVAKIGDSEITVEQFRQFYSDKLQEIGRQLRRPVTPEQVRALGLDRQLIGQMLAEAGLDQRARALGLGISDAEIARIITTDPTFRGLTGRFDRIRFEQLIRTAGFTELRFVAEQRRRTLRRQIADTLAGGLDAPKAAVAAINRYQNEQRTIEYIVLGPEKAGDVPAPTEEAIAKYYEERKTLLRAPEYRNVVVLALTPEELAGTMEIADADVKRAFEDRRSRYVTPERRHVQQIVFPNAEEARAAAERISKGTSFAWLAAERGLKEQDVDLGTVTKSAMVDPAMAGAAFSLKPGEVSAPVEGRFGTVLLHVVRVEPEQAKSFEQVAPEIRRELATERAKTELLALHDKIEEERAGGSSLTEAAKKLKLPVRTFEAIDRSGRGPDGQPVTNIPAVPDLLNRAFTTGIGVESDPLQVANGFVWYEVAAVTPSRERRLEEVKDQVAARLRDDEIASRLRAQARTMVGKVTDGADFAALAKADGLKVEKAEGLKRGNPPQGIPATLVEEVFRAKQGAPGSVEGDKTTERFVFRVTEVVVPNLDMASTDANRIEELVRRSFAEDIFNEYVTQIGQELGTTINQSALNQVVGGTAN